jgi:hypothetical protein
MVMLRNIMEGKYSFHSPEWDGVTGKFAKDIITFEIIVSDS